MFNFRNTTLAFFLLLFLLNILYAIGLPVHAWHYILLISAYLFLSVLFSFFIRSGFHMKVAFRGSPEEDKISLTFDDGPDPQLTPLVLDTLKAEQVKATFFLIGRKLEGNEPLVRRIVEEGHLIGCHSYSHSDWFDFYPPRRMKEEFIRTAASIHRITGRKIRLFRPPYGVINPMVKKALRKMNYEVIGYSNRLWDTVAKKEEKITGRYRRQLQPGDIVLLHDTSGVTVRILADLIRHTKSAGYSVVPLNELLNLVPYEIS